MSTSPEQAIAQRLAFENAPSWLPEPGSYITGRLANVRWYEHPEFGRSPVAVLNTATDAEPNYVAVYALHQTLTARLLELRPKLGEKITVAYGGKVPSRSRKDSRTGEAVEYHQYTVFTGDPADAVTSDSWEDPTA